MLHIYFHSLKQEFSWMVNIFFLYVCVFPFIFFLNSGCYFGGSWNFSLLISFWLRVNVAFKISCSFWRTHPTYRLNLLSAAMKMIQSFSYFLSGWWVFFCSHITFAAVSQYVKFQFLLCFFLTARQNVIAPSVRWF